MTPIERVFYFYVLPIGLSFGIALIIRFLSPHIAQRLVPTHGPRKNDWRTGEQHHARRRTLVSLVSGILTGVAFAIAGFISLATFINIDTLVWMIGLFGAGIGFGAKPFISDYMTGIAFIADDSFDVGEKIEVIGIVGVVEAVTLRITTLRGEDGERYTIPNGEIRQVRNFSRGQYTPINISVRVPAAEIQNAIAVLEELGEEAAEELPHLLGPWRVIAVDHTQLSSHAELTLAARAVFGKGAQTRPYILAMVQKRLASKTIELVD